MRFDEKDVMFIIHNEYWGEMVKKDGYHKS